MTTYYIVDEQGKSIPVESNDTELIHGVNVSGKYMGLVAKGTEYIHIDNPPADTKYTYDLI